MSWDPEFAERSAMLEPLRDAAAPLRAWDDWPQRDALQRLIDARGVRTFGGERLRLVAPDRTDLPYELRIQERGEMLFREREWHDLFNVLVWLTFPKTKAALNARHCAASLARARRPSAGVHRRGRTADALTLFDENGAIVASSDPALLEDLRGFRWRALFWERREAAAREMRIYIFGHALFEKALRPYVGMTAHAVPIGVGPGLLLEPLSAQLHSIDALGAEALAGIDSPRALSPLPVLGVPGWWGDNEVEAFYANAQYFRSGRREL